MIDLNILKSDEKAVFELRSLYGKYGYKAYKMGKFEEYELYMRNRDFLVSENIIAFNDTDGKLLALKPDVTLSIIKHSADEPGCVQKVYYNENVYRVSPRTHTYREILQTGLECIGDIDIYNIIEVINLAAESLSVISPDFVLDISHMGLLSAMIDSVTDNGALKQKIAECIAQKNIHDLVAACNEYGCDKHALEKLCEFTGIYGSMETVIAKLENVCPDGKAKAAYDELRLIFTLLRGTKLEKNIHFDFSIINGMNYYNGILFRGFIKGIPDSVLSGGRYDTLMRKMGRTSGAIGFAVYLDVLEQLDTNENEYDVDVLVLYDESTDISELKAKIDSITADGKSAAAQKGIPAKLRFRELIKLYSKEGVQ